MPHTRGNKVQDSSRYKLLVVDDEPRLRESLCNLLINSGYDTIMADGGRKAVAILSEQPVDILLLDLKMPGFSGHQVMDYIEENNIPTTVRVVSGETTFDAFSQVLRRRAYDYIKKPYAPDELLQTVENALNKIELERENRQIQNKLSDSEKLHRFLVNNSPDLVYMLDQQGHFNFVNDRMSSLLGYPRAELIGMHHEKLVYFEDIEQARFAFNERRTGDRAVRNVELRLKCKSDDNKLKHFEANTIPIELHATGVYQETGDGEKTFIGTYGVARDITERKEAEKTIHFQAYHDLLTHLPNRALFSSNQRLAIMFLDLDRFKLINDTMGHISGDELLQSVSKRLQDCLREGDTLARFGGDEFTLLLPQIYSQDDAEAIAKKIIAKLQAPFHINGSEIFITVSIGIAMYPHDGTNMDTLVKSADIAMYHIKGRGKNDYQFFSSDMNEVSIKRLSLERDMRKALEADEFELYYQPQIDVATGRVVATEALVRWFHPELGVIGPTDFISVAEDSGLILQLGEWVLRRSLEALRRWKDAGINDIRMAVNLSSLQVEHKHFVPTLIDALQQNGLDSSDLEVEITENLIMQDMDNSIRKLVEIASHGVNIAIDDFGTGYSSLSYLQKLPIHTLKIDRSFVHEIKSGHGSCIVDAVIAMAKGLKMNIIAEGVETRQQYEYLQARGCDQVQGFLFAKPLDEAGIVEVIQQSPATMASVAS